MSRPSDRRPDAVYLDEVRNCDLYLGLFGDEYGWENKDGFSPTHLEFNEATRLGKTRLIFVKGASDDAKHPKMRVLIREAGAQLVRRRFQESADLLPDVYASLVDYLEETGKLNRAPWDARAPRKVSLDDLDPENVTRFVRRARKARNFPLPGRGGFGEDPDAPEPARRRQSDQRRHPPLRQTPPAILPSFRGQVRPLPRHRGRQADSVLPGLQRHRLRTGRSGHRLRHVQDQRQRRHPREERRRPRSPTRSRATSSPRPSSTPSPTATTTATAASRSCSSPTGWRSGIPARCPRRSPSRTCAGRTAPFPGNPLLAEPLYLTKYIERMGTGTRDMIHRCRKAGLPEPEIRLDGGSFVLTIRRPATGSATQSGTQSRPGQDQGGQPG